MDTIEFDAYFIGRARYFDAAEIRFMGGSNEHGKAQGLNTLPPEELWPNILPTLQMADILRKEFGQPLRILSAYRSTAYNAAIGGELNSFHKKFMALDLTPASGRDDEIQRLKECARRLREAGTLTGGLGEYPWGIHIDCGPRRRW